MKRFRFGGGEEGESMNMANVLMLLSRSGGGGGGGSSSSGGEESVNSVQTSPGRVFECKTCNRQFPSFQALGGHRASHKKPRLTAEGQTQSGPAKPRVHECSICGLEFAIGQALGGHMRRHRAAADGFGHGQLVVKKPEGRRVLSLDLNLPPSENDIECRQIGFGIEIVDKIPMVDCLH